MHRAVNHAHDRSDVWPVPDQRGFLPGDEYFVVEVECWKRVEFNQERVSATSEMNTCGCGDEAVVEEPVYPSKTVRLALSQDVRSV